MTELSPAAAAILNKLNPAQREAVTAPPGPLLIIAGAGSGKTSVLTRRIAYLIAAFGVHPEQILAVTFTNKAAAELRNRVERLVGGGQASRITMGTFHSVCNRFLRIEHEAAGLIRNFTILDEDDQKSVARKLCVDDLEDAKPDLKDMLNIISLAKNKLQSPEDLEELAIRPYDKMVVTLWRRYAKACADLHAVDFDDLLVKVVQTLERSAAVRSKWQGKFDHVLVDEFQDTNVVQARLTDLLAARTGNLTVVGDDAQCLVAGTRVQTPRGRKKIEDVSEGDKVMSGVGGGRVAASIVDKVMRKKYRGTIVTIKTTEGDMLTGTPNHLVFSRIMPETDLHHVYLMQKSGLGYRIGRTSGVRRDVGRDERGHGLHSRMRGERADHAWLLGSFGTAVAAALEEARYAAKYGIPMTVFRAGGRSTSMRQSDIQDLFDSIDTEERAHRLLRDLHLFPEYPHTNNGAIVRGGVVRRVVNFTMFGDHRARGGEPLQHHRIQLVTSGDAMRSAVGTAFTTRKPNGSKTWRVETARANHDEGVAFSKRLAQQCDGEVKVRASFITKPDRSGGSAPTFAMMPLSHVHPGMRVPVLRDGTIVEATVATRTLKNYDGEVFDLSVRNTRNFIAGGIVGSNSVYRWRGADITNILDFEKTYPGARTVSLEENYRSTQPILDAANVVLKYATDVRPKTLFTQKKVGYKPILVRCEDQQDEAQYVIRRIQELKAKGVSLKDIVVVYRTSSLSAVIEQNCVAAGIDYQIVGGTKFFQRKEIKDALSYLRTMLNPHNDIAFFRALSNPPRGVGEKSQHSLLQHATTYGMDLLSACESMVLPGKSGKGLREFYDFIKLLQQRAPTLTLAELLQEIVDGSGLYKVVKNEKDDERRQDNLEQLATLSAEFEELSYPESAEAFLERAALLSQEDSPNDEKQKITLMTLHAVKGLEYSVVFMVGSDDGILPHINSFDDPPKLEEERRLAYVGVTRAKDVLYLMSARRRQMRGTWQSYVPSRFVSEMLENKVLDELESQPPGSRSPASGGYGAESSWGGGSYGKGSYSKGSYGKPGTGAPYQQKSYGGAKSTPWKYATGNGAAAKPTPKKATPKYQVGHTVYHDVHKQGQVLEVKDAPTFGPDEKYVKVRFQGDDKAERTLLASTSPMRIIG